MENNTGSFPERYEKTEKNRTYLNLGLFLDETGIKESDLPKKPDLDKLNLSSGMKAEMMWGLFKEVRKEIWSHPKKEKVCTFPDKQTKEKKEKLISKKIKIKENKELGLKVALLKGFWKDEDVKERYKEEYDRHLREEKEINGDYEKYKFLKREIVKSEKSFDRLSAQVFSQRDLKGNNELLNILYNTSEIELKENRNKLGGLLVDNHELKSLAVYDKLTNYERQLKENDFIWLPSRRKVLEKIETAVISGRPVLIESESGTGKTALVKEVAQKLTDQEVVRLVGKSDVKPEKLFATPDFTVDGGHYRYGPITEAITGKGSEKEGNPKHRGRIVFDDEWNKRTADHQMELIKTIAEVQSSQKFNVPDTSIWEVIQPRFAFVVAGNPNSDRYQRQETDVAVRREFGSNKIDLDYPEQTLDNPELFSLLLTGLMQNGRLRVNEKEIKPKFILKDGKYHISDEPKDGGFLWRFANAWRSSFDSFKHQENALSRAKPSDPKENFYLDRLLLDMGVVLGWLKEYHRGLNQVSLEEFLSKKTIDFINQADEERDQQLAKNLFKHFGIDLEKDFSTKGELKILTPQDIGELLVGPKVDKYSNFVENGQLFDEGGNEIRYIRLIPAGFSEGQAVKDIESGKVFYLMGGNYLHDQLGKTIGSQAVLIDENGLGVEVPVDTLKDKYKVINEIKEKQGISLEKAREIFGESFYGPDEIKTTLGFEFPGNEIPPINCSREELEKAQEAGEELVLCIDHDNHGNPMTADQLLKIMASRMDGKLLYSQKEGGSSKLEDDCWYKNEAFFKSDSLRMEWRLVGKEPLSDTPSKNHVQQTKILRDKMIELGVLSQEEIEECSDVKLGELQRLLDENKAEEATREMSQMKIEQYKPSFAELMYLGAIQYKNYKRRGCLEDKYTWTRDISSDGFRVIGGDFVSDGFSATHHWDDVSSSDLGLLSSRSLSKIDS